MAPGEAISAILEYERAEVSWRRLLVESGKAIVLNVAAPLALLVQTAVLGSIEYSSLSAYTLVQSATSLASVIFNFLTDGVSSKVSKSAGEGNWKRVKANVRYSYAFAIALGLACAVLLVGCFKPIFMAAGMPAHLQKEAYGFYVIRAVQIPLVQISMANVGILSGYQRLGVGAALNVMRAGLDIVGTFVSLVVLKGRLFDLGLAGLLSYFITALIGCVCVLTSKPKNAPESFTLLGRQPLHVNTDQYAGLGTEPQSLEPLLDRIQDHTGEDTRGSSNDGDNAGSVLDSHFWDFFYDGANMLVRSLSLQASFFLASILASRLPSSTEALAAHGVIVQLWMVTSYVADGFANVGTMLGGKFYGSWSPLDEHCFFRMTERLIFCGIIIGALFSISMLLLEDQIIHVFTLKNSASRDVVIAYLHKAWPVLCVMQPVNSLVFVYDGLIYAVQRFKYVRNLMVSGLLFAYAHVLVISYFLGYLSTRSGLVFIWLAKSAMNIWRLGGLAVEIHLKVSA